MSYQLQKMRKIRGNHSRSFLRSSQHNKRRLTNLGCAPMIIRMCVGMERVPQQVGQQRIASQYRRKNYPSLEVSVHRNLKCICRMLKERPESGYGFSIEAFNGYCSKAGSGKSGRSEVGFRHHFIPQVRDEQGNIFVDKVFEKIDRLTSSLNL